jgi:hypothetical protein
MPDGSYSDNTGAYLSLNFGMPIPLFSEEGLGFQLGGSYGLYDWSGRANLFGNPKELQQQGFFTTGLFWTTPCCSGFNFGLVYDLMFNRNFGCFVVDANFSQVRFKGGYLMDCCDEFGFWGTAAVDKASNHVASDERIKYKAINQVSLFWQHNFCMGAETMIWAGMPYSDGLKKHSRAGSFLVGASFRVPLNDCWSINGHASYMRTRSSKGIEESKGYGSNVCIGLVYAFGCGKGYSSRPYLPVADNSSFLADTNLNY